MLEVVLLEMAVVFLDGVSDGEDGGDRDSSCVGDCGGDLGDGGSVGDGSVFADNIALEILVML